MRYECRLEVKLYQSQIEVRSFYPAAFKASTWYLYGSKTCSDVRIRWNGCFKFRRTIRQSPKRSLNLIIGYMNLQNWSLKTEFLPEIGNPTSKRFITLGESLKIYLKSLKRKLVCIPNRYYRFSGLIRNFRIGNKLWHLGTPSWEVPNGNSKLECDWWTTIFSVQLSLRRRLSPWLGDLKI
jgi:hypothetical protein